MFYQIFLSPQVKRWPIITYKHGIYELPQQLPNNLKLRISGNQEKSATVWTRYNDCLVSSLPAKMKFLLTLAEKYWKTDTKLFDLCTISHES